jgi:hypothetical protein
MTDPLADFEPYWILCPRATSRMFHCWWQSGGAGKFMWAVSLVRLAGGSRQNLHVERRWMEVALKMQGNDGLIYTPTRGRPWAFVGCPDGLEQEIRRNAEALGGQDLNPFGNGAMLGAMAHFARRDGGPLWRQATRKLVDGMVRLAVDAGDIAYYYPSVFATARERPSKPPVPATWSYSGSTSECEGTIIPHGLVRAYRLLGYEPALTLARKLINWLRRNFYGPEGCFLATPGNRRFAHFHAHARGLLAMEEFSEAAGDQELMQFVVSAYEYAKGLIARQNVDDPSQTPVSQGANLIGYFPEWANSGRFESGETCQQTDMIALALRLSEAGVADYWDDADRWLRNHFAEAQLLNADWITRLPQDLPMWADGIFKDSPKEYSTTERVPERYLGGFAGAPDPNDWSAGRSTGLCCLVNGSKALYWIWDRILRYHDGKLRVNLLLNRASAWADVDSYIPYQGRVDVKVKQPLDLRIRIPEWAAPPEVRCAVDGHERALGWEGRYAVVGCVQPGQVASLTFPIPLRTDHVQIQKRPYTLVRKGNDVISIDPPGRYCPTYQREHYRSNAPRWRPVTRFVSREKVDS